MSNQSKEITVTGLGNTIVSGTKGSWIKTSGVNFSNGASKLKIKASSKSGAVIKVCTDSINGTVLTYAEIPSEGTMTEITVPVINTVSGSQDIYFLFSNDVNLDSWVFS